MGYDLQSEYLELPFKKTQERLRTTALFATQITACAARLRRSGANNVISPPSFPVELVHPMGTYSSTGKIVGNCLVGRALPVKS